MQLSKAIFAIIIMSMISGNLNAQQVDSENISEYYGFEEIEIIKLDWGIKDLRVADFNGDGRKDIALTNNRRARIEILFQKEAIGPGKKEFAIDPNDIDVNAINPPTRFEQQSIAVSQKLHNLVHPHQAVCFLFRRHGQSPNLKILPYRFHDSALNLIFVSAPPELPISIVPCNFFTNMGTN